MDKNKDNQAIQKQTANSASETPRSVDDAAGAVAKVIRNTETQNEIEKLEDRLKIAERWMIYLTAAIALFAFGSVLVGILQWNAMRGQLDEMKHGADDTAKQFRLMQASDVGVVSVSMIDRITSRFTITNFGNLTARNVIIRVKEDHFPSIHAMTFFQYDPLSELDSFRSDQTIQHHREALTRGESLETVSAIGPIWQSVGRLRHNDQWSYDYKFPFPAASSPEQAVICFLVRIDWDDALEHRKGSTCQLFINAKPVGCHQFVLGLPAPKPEAP